MSEEGGEQVPVSLPKVNALASTSLILGLLSVCGGITAIPGIIFGILGIRKARSIGGAGKWIAIVGIVLSCLGLMAPGLWYLAQLWIGEAALRMSTTNNLKQLSIAQASYNDANGKIPHPYYYEGPAGGEPELLSDRLSWRVALLPYVESSDLYIRVKRNESWNSPANLPLSKYAYRPYRDPDTETDPDTRYRIFYGGGAAYDFVRPMKVEKIPDGASNTIAIVEGGEKVTWTQFNDYPFSMDGPLPVLGRPDSSSFQVAMFDYSVRTIRKSIDPKVLKSGIHASDGFPLGE